MGVGNRLAFLVPRFRRRGPTEHRHGDDECRKRGELPVSRAPGTRTIAAVRLTSHEALR
jgi:hypothetical protein